MNRELPRVGHLERFYALVGLLFLVGTFHPLIFGTQQYYGAFYTQLNVGNTKFQIISGSIYLISTIVLISNSSRVLVLVRQNWILFLFVVFIFLSGFWADVPQASFRRSLALVGTTTFAI
jgi:hypothetical protein